MPFISVNCPSGSHKFWYSICTPQSTYAKQIQPGLPTLLFIHSAWCAQEIFEYQFADPRLRQFNLVAVDMLGHGSAKGFINGKRYTPKETAVDLECVAVALRLPPLHLVGLSIGGTIALEMASAYPQRVLSVTVCSPITHSEAEDMIASRETVYTYWCDALATPPPEEDNETKKREREELLRELVAGVTHLSLGEIESPIHKALQAVGLLRSLTRYSGDAQRLQLAREACIKWFSERVPMTREEFARIQCPVTLIWGMEDAGYTLENARDWEAKLKDAGNTSIKLCTVTGPHYGVFANPKEINPVIRETVLSTNPDATPRLAPHIPSADDDELVELVETPWTGLLARYGYVRCVNNNTPLKVRRHMHKHEHGGACGSDSEEEGWLTRSREGLIEEDTDGDE